MIDSAIQWALGFDLTGQMGLLMYWLPMLLCAFGYIARTFKRYRQCCELRDADKYFQSDTLGTLIGRAIVTVLPIVNLLAAIFDLGPKIFGNFFEAIGKVFNQPLVSK